MRIVLAKAGVRFDAISPAGFRLLSAIEGAARRIGVDLTITSACDGAHAGPNDAHHFGSAYDVRSRDLSDAQTLAVLREVLLNCADGPADAPVEKDGGLVTRLFYGFHESAGTPNAHLHFQLRNSRVYPS